MILMLAVIFILVVIRKKTKSEAKTFQIFLPSVAINKRDLEYQANNQGKGGVIHRDLSFVVRINILQSRMTICFLRLMPLIHICHCGP